MSVDKETAISKSREYFGGNEMAAELWVDKYCLRDADNNLLETTPDDMHKRLAREFYAVEKLYKQPMSEQEIYELFKDFKYVIPQGSPMAAIGDPYRVQSASNCFVVDSPQDSYGGICKTDEELAQIMKRRGGVGCDISTIRPKGMATSNAARTTDGIVPYMHRFSNTCREVAQGGRRGALMLTCNVHHPEIVSFINSKRDKTKVTGANISVRFTDEFMSALHNGHTYTQRWPLDKPAQIRQSVLAQEVWDEFISAAYDSAEPGAQFVGNISKGPAEIYCPSVSTNPCGEIPLNPYDSCRLMAINLFSFVVSPFTPEAYFDYPLFSSVVIKAQRLMDDMVDIELGAIKRILKKIESDPESWAVTVTEHTLWKKIEQAAMKLRRTGLGITGLADCLAGLGHQYGSESSVEVTSSIYENLAKWSYASSIMLAKERGSFMLFNLDKERNCSHIQGILAALPQEYRDMYECYGRRNAASTTTAPTGTISNLACVDQKRRIFGVSSGIEPVFQLEYTRRKKITGTDNLTVNFTDDSGDRWHHFKVYHPALKLELEINPTALSAYTGALANDVPALSGIKLQAAAQKWVDHAISKTANCPADTTKEQVSEMYMTAWKLGLKGFTIYREGSRDGVLIAKEGQTKFEQHNAPKRPKDLPCDVYLTQINKEPWIVFVGLLDGKPYEVMAGTKVSFVGSKIVGGKNVGIIRKNSHGKQNATYSLLDNSGDCIVQDISAACGNPLHAAFSRTISLSLRHGANVSFLVEQLVKGAKDESSMQAYSKVVARVLKNYIPNNTKSTEKQCPQCSCADLIFVEGCVTCTSCGYSKCG